MKVKANSTVCLNKMVHRLILEKLAIRLWEYSDEAIDNGYEYTNCVSGNLGDAIQKGSREIRKLTFF